MDLRTTVRAPSTSFADEARTMKRLRVALALFALSLPTLVHADATDVAREHFKAGVRHLQDPDGARYEDAYREFRAAYATTPSPKILGNIGLCAMKLERDGEAIDAYTRYLAEVPDVDAEERDQITKDLQAMKSGVVRVTLAFKGAGAVTFVDTRTPTTGIPVVNVYGPVSGETSIGVRPGRHRIEARAANGDQAAAWELDAAPGSQAQHLFVVAPKEVPQSVKTPVHLEDPPSHVAPWTLTIAGGAMLVGGAVTGAIAMSKYQKLESRCPDSTCPTNSGLDADRDSIKRYTRATDILLIGGGVVAATGIVWLIATPSARPTDKDVAIGCGAGGCTFTLMGRF